MSAIYVSKTGRRVYTDGRDFRRIHDQLVRQLAETQNAKPRC
jgi:hypothetical protein